MSKNCDSKNPLIRGGTSQKQRLLDTLLPSYVAVDERSLEDLIEFANKYAKEIQFYDSDNIADGNWEDFFDKKIDENQRNEAHYALFITFLRLFKFGQDDLNTITKRHLDFYYSEVLKLDNKSAIPDQVFIIFELAKHVTSTKIAEGTKLKAGKDDTGVNVVYETDSEIVINPGKVKELKSLFYNKDDNFRLYSSSVVNSQDGEGGELTTEDKSWVTFGGTDRTEAEVGFALASPILFLAEGDRKVIVVLKFPTESFNNTGDLSTSDLTNALEVVFSGEEKWIEPAATEDTITQIHNRIFSFLNSATTAQEIKDKVQDDPTTGYGDQINDPGIGLVVAQRILDEMPTGGYSSTTELLDIFGFNQDKLNDLIYTFTNNTTYVDVDKRQIVIIRTITKDQEAIVAYDKMILTDPFSTKWPVMKITLDPDQTNNPYIYADLKDLQPEVIDIHVNVIGVKTLVIQNDLAKLNPSKPFQPFGNRPVLGSNFYAGSKEIFQKALLTLNVNLKWQGLPNDFLEFPEGFQQYYEGYVPTFENNKRLNKNFKVEVSILEDKVWIDLDDHRLFKDDDPDNSIPIPADQIIAITSSELQDKVERDTSLETISEFDTTTVKGFLRFRLIDIDFGHKNFQASFTQSVVDAVDQPTGAEFPHEPYTPMLEELSIDYSSVESIQVNGNTGDNDNDDVRVEQFFHVHPFGVAEQDLTKGTIQLLPQFKAIDSDNNLLDAEGALYIGIEDLDLSISRSLSLLLQVAEGSPNPELNKEDIVWSYLDDNEWVKFPNVNIISDGTNDLLKSGVVSFDIPKSATSTNTILTSKLHWIRASVISNSAAISDIIDIKAQAVVASFKDNKNDPNYLKTPLAAESISKLVESNSSVDSVSQLFTSFGGKIIEESSNYYTRVSERLKHKGRAITIDDYEKLILEKFPDTYMVKALDHTQFEGGLNNYSELAPGHVSLIIISNLTNKNAVDPLKPKTSLITLTEIDEYIKAINPPCAITHVKNPIYEEIRVKLNVMFHQGLDKGLYEQQLITDIKKFLAPWAFDGDVDISFGGTIHKSVILNFVEELSYVDFLTCFEMFHSHHTDPNEDIDEAVASTAASILGSAETHMIKVLEAHDDKITECDCEDNDVAEPIVIGSVDDCGCD